MVFGSRQSQNRTDWQLEGRRRIAVGSTAPNISCGGPAQRVKRLPPVNSLTVVYPSLGEGGIITRTHICLFFYELTEG